MNSESNNIMGYDRELTEQEIRDYHSGKLSDSEMNLIERTAESRPLSRDALEGWQGGASATIEEIRGEVTKRSSGNTLFYAALTIGVVLGGIIGIWIALDSNDNNLLSEAVEAKPAVSEVAAEETGVIELDPVDVLAHHVTDSSVSITTSRSQDVEASADQFVVRTRIEQPEALELKQISQVEPSSELTGEKEVKLLAGGARIYHIEEYKVVDYRGIREEPISQWQTSPGGVSAQFENEDAAQSGEFDAQIVSVPYVDFLEDMMVKFSRANFEEVITDCDEILEAYPDDANALFYSGMANFYLESYDKAIVNLTESSKLPVGTFKEESEFYLARSLKLEGYEDESKALFGKIAEGQGFYAEQARDFLKE